MPTDTKRNYPTTPTDASTGNEAAANSDKTFDRFHPEMPSIPGVSNTSSRVPAHSDKRSAAADTRRIAQIGGMIAAFVVVTVGILWWIRHASHAPVASTSSESVASQSSSAELPTFPSIVPSSEVPTVAATVEELSKAWSSKRFVFVKPLTQENVDGIVIRLPGGGLWAFALEEPTKQCDLEFATNLVQIEQKYGYRATHPMVVSPCTRTVYDPLKVGPLGGSTWARGEVVQGLGIRPPISIDVRLRGRSIIADAIE